MRDLQRHQTKDNNILAAQEGYDSLKESVALVDHEARVLLGLSGKDSSGPAGLLAAILTNEIPNRENLGVYGLLLDAKGRVRTDLKILKRPGGSLVAETEPEGASAAREILGRYAPFSRVKIEEFSDASDASGASEATDESWGVLGLYGPGASETLAGLLGEAVELEEHQTVEITPPGSETPLLISGVYRPVAGYELIGPSHAVSGARESLLSAGVSQAPTDSYEALRIENGLPRFGSDLTPENFPGEAGILARAVSFAKGCYPGQETVARMHYRGHPNRALYRLSVDAGEGTQPEPGARITQNGTEVGYLTSLSPLGDGSALGYLHRKADATAPLEAAGAGIQAISAV
jgi:folate-binding protein YgfZ